MEVLQQKEDVMHPQQLWAIPAVELWLLQGPCVSCRWVVASNCTAMLEMLFLSCYTAAVMGCKSCQNAC